MCSDEPSEPRKPFLVGYARVSTEDQDNARQREELIRYGVNALDIFQDKPAPLPVMDGWIRSRAIRQACARRIGE